LSSLKVYIASHKSPPKSENKIWEAIFVPAEKSNIQALHEEQGRTNIQKLKSKIDTTKHNIEISEAIIDETPFDKERQKLIDKNTNRQHAIGSMEKEIRDIEQTMAERSREVSL